MRGKYLAFLFVGFALGMLGSGTVVIALFRHDIIATKSGFLDYDRWNRSVLPCDFKETPEAYNRRVFELLYPPNGQQQTPAEIEPSLPLTLPLRGFQPELWVSAAFR
ncbi:MAG TPA: hypothetical protein VN808_02080 [Stellaceae bacterium]|nr:hypothetical protein [Stellaceae bacterium]